MKYEFLDNGLIADLKNAPPKVATSLVRAMRRALTSGRAALAQSVGEDTGLKASVIKEAIRDEVLSVGHGVVEGRLTASKKGIPLIDYRARGRYPSRGRGAGVTWRLAGASITYRHAFIAVMPNSGHRGVFARSVSPEKFMRAQKPSWQKKRHAIHEEFGPSIWSLSVKRRPIAVEAAQTSFAKNFTQQLKFTGAGVVDA